MKLNKQIYQLAGLELINLALNTCIILFMWSLSHPFCIAVTGLFIAKDAYIKILTFLKKKEYLKQYNQIMDSQKAIISNGTHTPPPNNVIEMKGTLNDQV